MRYTNDEEDFAARFVRAMGLSIILRNARTHGAELDLVCRNRDAGEIIVFEVKKRRASRFSAYPAISWRQRRRLTDAVLQLQYDADRFLPVRICVMLVDLMRGSVEVITDAHGIADR